jgi:hypothetical protein
MRARSILSLGFSTLLLTAVIFAFLFRQEISDYIRLRGYTPSNQVIDLADDTTMVPAARRLFYVYRPQITDSETFNKHCRGHGNEYTIVLGCYISNDGIYLLDVKDERLRGIKEVTAAHELLHAAYERVGKKERQELDELLLETFAEINDERIRQTVEQYRKQDPAIVPNELHSILGSEVRDLPVQLEEYYARYFLDRSRVVSFSELYEQAFVERRNIVRDYDAQLAELRTRIDSMEAQLRQTDVELRAQREQMNYLRSSGQSEAYNAMVPDYNSKVNRYNNEVDELSSLIVQFNDIVQKRNSVAAEEAELVEAIDSRDVVPAQQ